MKHLNLEDYGKIINYSMNVKIIEKLILSIDMKSN